MKEMWFVLTSWQIPDFVAKGVKSKKILKEGDN